MSEVTLGQRLSRGERKKLNDEVIASNYDGGQIFARVEYKAEEDGDSDFLKPLKFQGYGNTGVPDLGRDIVDSKAFTNQTIGEYLKFGRQLMFMHDFFEQVGEITAAKRIAKGKNNPFGIEDGGLWVEGFVDSPVDEELGYIPDHPLAKVIHYVRMQVRRNRLKALSIGWRPVKWEIRKMPDPRFNNEEFNFRIVKQLMLREMSLVTFAMNPQSMVELRKAFEGMYGPDITAAMFCDEYECRLPGQGMGKVPEKVDDLDEENVRRIISSCAAKHAKGAQSEEPNAVKGDHGDASGRRIKLVSLHDRIEKKIELVSLKKGF